jgi:hypothetical protein
VSRDDQAICGEIKAAIAFVIRRVAKEDTPGGSGAELMGSGGGGVRIAHIVFKAIRRGVAIHPLLTF